MIALFNRQLLERVHAVRPILDQIGNSQDWGSQVDEAVELIASLRAASPGSTALRRAMRSSADLAVLDQQVNALVSQWLGAALQRLTGMPEPQAWRVARVMIEMHVALLDWWESPEANRDPMVLHETKAALKAYLSLYTTGKGL